MPNDPSTSTTAAIAITMVRSRPECRMDSRARLRPKYMKKRNIHQYIRMRVTFLREENLKRSRKLYSFTLILGSITLATRNCKVSAYRVPYFR